MPSYYLLRNMSKRNRKRTISGLERLRKQLDAEIPRRTRNSTVVLGTFNIRNFDDNRFMNGKRTDEDLFYLAEIISRFDVVAVQEVCDDIKPLKRLMRILGRDYDFIVTDPTEGKSGNDERLGFIFDTSKVWFRGIAGELVLPDSMQIVYDGKKLQFSRTPFMCSFQSGWFKFMFSTVHIYFGSASGTKYERRLDEIDKVARFIAKLAKADEQNYILVGDFNIKKPGSRGYNALEKHKFEIFQNKVGSNKDQTKFYDQISFRTREDEVCLTETDQSKGVFQFFDSIFREEDFVSYKPELKKTVEAKIVKLEEDIEEEKQKLTKTSSDKTKERLTKSIAKKKKAVVSWKSHLQNDSKLQEYYLKDWRTFHASDHLPLWVELKTDFSSNYLEKLKE